MSTTAIINKIVALLLAPAQWVCGQRGHSWFYPTRQGVGRCYSCGKWHSLRGDGSAR